MFLNLRGQGIAFMLSRHEDIVTRAGHTRHILGDADDVSCLGGAGNERSREVAYTLTSISHAARGIRDEAGRHELCSAKSNIPSTRDQLIIMMQPAKY